MQWTGIGDNDTHATSDTKPVEHLPLTFERFDRHGLIDTMRLEKTIEFDASPEAQRAAQFRPGHPASTVFLKSQRFPRTAFEIPAAGARRHVTAHSADRRREPA